MKTLWIFAFCCVAFLVVDAKKGKYHRLFKWKHHTRKSSVNVNCTELPSRLLDWFHVLRTAHIRDEMNTHGLPLPQYGEVLPEMELREAKITLPSDFDQEACREPISSVFRYVFDENRDGMLEESELAIVYGTDTYDPCMKEFFNECTKGKESLTEKEFCSCFSAVEPPCLHKLRQNLPLLLVRGETRPIPGVHIPSCDQDGYYMPKQCKVLDQQGTKKCWCVDRHGSKIEGMTDCVDNTEPPTS